MAGFAADGYLVLFPSDVVLACVGYPQELLKVAPLYDCVFRPSSRGPNFLTLMWKMTDTIIHSFCTWLRACAALLMNCAGTEQRFILKRGGDTCCTSFCMAWMDLCIGLADDHSYFLLDVCVQWWKNQKKIRPNPFACWVMCSR